jgi:hypothetical protein
VNWIRLILLPVLILATGLGVTWTAWDHERDAANKELHFQFASVLRETVSRIEQRMASYEQMLHGVQGLVAATGSIDRDLSRLCRCAEPGRQFLGIQAISIETVPRHRHACHLARMAARASKTTRCVRPARGRPMPRPSC